MKDKPQTTPDLTWLRKHSPIFALMHDKIKEVKKSEAEYKKLRLTETKALQ